MNLPYLSFVNITSNGKVHGQRLVQVKIPGVGFVISINLKQCLDKIVRDDINFYKFNTKVIALETKKWNRFCYSVPNRIQSTKKQNLNPDSITLFCVGLV